MSISPGSENQIALKHWLCAGPNSAMSNHCPIFNSCISVFKMLCCQQCFFNHGKLLSQLTDVQLDAKSEILWCPTCTKVIRNLLQQFKTKQTCSVNCQTFFCDNSSLHFNTPTNHMTQAQLRNGMDKHVLDQSLGLPMGKFSERSEILVPSIFILLLLLVLLLLFFFIP